MFRRKLVRDNVNIRISNYVIEQVKCTKFLGMLVDENLNWFEHTKSVTKKIARSIGVIKHLRKYLPKIILPSLYIRR